MEEGLIKKLMASVKCGTCGQNYEIDDINVLGHEEDLWFLSVSCPACHTRYLVAALIREGEAPELITDLTETELDMFENADGPTVNEVLDMHNFLQGFDGDFIELFSQK